MPRKLLHCSHFKDGETEVQKGQLTSYMIGASE